MPNPFDKIKILYIIPTLDYGGAERQLIQLSINLDKRLFDVAVVLLSDRSRLLTETYSDTQAIRVVKLKDSGRYNLLKLFELRRLYKQERPDIIHTFLPTANFWGCLSAKLFSKAAIIASLRGLHHNYLNKFYVADFLSFKLLADFVTVNSEAVKENCVNFLTVKSNKIRKINNSVIINSDTLGYDRSHIFKNLGIEDKGVSVISTVGRLDKLKGIEFFVQAASVLVRGGVRAIFLIAGKGPLEKQLKKDITDLGLGETVKFLGEVKSVKELFFVSDIFVLPTLSEGCSNVILEAMASGMPIVTTSISANKELIEDNKTGLLVRPGDSQALANAVLKFIKEPQFAKKCGLNAQDKAKRKYDICKMAEKYEEFYRGLKNRKKACN